MYDWTCVVCVVLSMTTMVFAETEPQPLESDLAIEASAAAVVLVWPVDPPPLKEGVTEERIVVRARNGHRDRLVYDVVSPTVRVFLPEQQNAARPAVLICPGGAYQGLVYDREGCRIADWLRSQGIVAIVLKYRLSVGVTPGEGEMPPSIADGLRAMKLVRAHAAEWNIDPNRIGIMGFSAGGHLAGTVATQFDEGDADASDVVERESSRPDFAVLVYPVASMRADVTHMGSRNNLIGKDADRATEDRFSTAQRVTPRTPPLFLVHADDDQAVPITNSLEVLDAAERAGVPCAFMRYEKGGHGFALGSRANGTDSWPPQCIDWLRAGGFLAE